MADLTPPPTSEAILLEYQQLSTILERASQNESLEVYLREMVLHVDPQTHHITHANPQALDYLGYTLAQLQQHRIDQLQQITSAAHPTSYTETSQEILVYEGTFRHHNGSSLPTRVRRRYIGAATTPLIHYSLEDLSLRGMLVRELLRREDDSFHFREKLKILNSIGNQIGQCTSFDDLCRQSIALGIQHLGFDRLSLWFLNPERKRMEGSFGTDETGNLRDERGQYWTFEDTFVEDYLRGKREPTVTEDSAPLYNEKSQIIAYGWHMSVPLLNGNQVIGFMGADNLIHQHALKSYQPELLRLYGATIGHLAANQLERATILKLSRAIESSASMILILAPDFTLEFANTAFYRATGYVAAEVIGQPIQRFVLLPRVPPQPEWKGEAHLQHKDGSHSDTFASLSPITIEGQFKNYVLVQDDITELKKARQQELELRLEQERVRVLQSFVTDLGHEFKTPLSIIMTQAYLLQASTDTHKLAERIQKITLYAQYLNSILDDMLYTIQLERGMAFDFQAVQLHLLLPELIQTFQPQAAAKHQVLSSDLHPTTPIMADVPQLAKAIQELLTNAIHYTPAQGQIQLSVQEDEQHVILTVEDTGIGIAEKHLPKIFDHFYRVESARTTRGTGLGLTIVKHIITAH